MYAIERHQEILSRARADGQVEVKRITDDLDVTPETVRRDAANAITATRGLTIADLGEAAAKRALIAAARRTVVLADLMKFGRADLAHVCDLEAIDTVLADTLADTLAGTLSDLVPALTTSTTEGES